MNTVLYYVPNLIDFIGISVHVVGIDRKGQRVLYSLFFYYYILVSIFIFHS